MTRGAAGKAANALVPADPAAGRGRAGDGAWRPAAPFLAQVIGERARGSRLGHARRNVPGILGAYGAAAALAPASAPGFDLSI